jgi:transposase
MLVGGGLYGLICDDCHQNKEFVRMAVIEVQRRYCGQGKVIKNSKAPNGLQRFHCQACRRYFQVEYCYNGHKPGTAQRIVELAFNRSGVRDTSRVLGISKDTVTRRLKKN